LGHKTRIQPDKFKNLFFFYRSCGQTGLWQELALFLKNAKSVAAVVALSAIMIIFVG
jgi:hypothetical protein